jgi:rhodanese-related sulfurtransferase
MQTISRNELRQKLSNGHDLAVVEVLPEANYRKFHLPGAINVPLRDDFDERIQQAIPEKTQPVVVYCQSTECDASPKAAKRMDELGYQEVYDYEPGKADWEAAGLPIES